MEIHQAVSQEQIQTLLSEGPLLLFDGSCGVCNRSVQWILAHETRRDLRFLPLESELGIALRKKAEISPNVDSLVWLEAPAGEMKARIYSAAAISAARYVGGGFRALAFALWLVPRPLRDLAYRGFARVRHHVAPSACFLPTPEERLRFLN